MGYETKNLDHLGIVSGMCDRIDLVSQINSFFPDKATKVSVGESVKAMILNALGFVSRPLYLSSEFLAKKPVDLLFRRELRAEDFNDDTLGRALDSLYKADVTSIFSQVASHSLKEFGLRHKLFHLDSTSFSLHGDYPEQVQENPDEPVPIKITRGYSKDQHPELNQAVFSLICAYKSTLPVWVEALDGNSSDKKSFPETIEHFVEGFEGESPPCFIVDSALYTKENIQRLSTTGWITRVPETIALAKKVIDETPAASFVKTQEEGYYLCETTSSYGDVKHRWILVFSEKAKQRESKTFLKRFEKAQEKAEKEFNKLKTQEFNCREDAEKTLCRLEKKWRFHHVEAVKFIEILHYKTKGRPKKDALPDQTSWKIDGDLCVHEDAVEEAMDKLGRFILATNQSKEKLSGQEALGDYKAQGSSVERGFRFLKDPMFFSSSLFLQKPSRIMALLMVMALSLLVYSLAERELRQQLQERNETVPDQKGKPTQKITMRRTFQMFEGVSVLYIKGEEPSQRLVLNLTEVQRRILGYLGSEVKKCYQLE